MSTISIGSSIDSSILSLLDVALFAVVVVVGTVLSTTKTESVSEYKRRYRNSNDSSSCRLRLRCRRLRRKSFVKNVDETTKEKENEEARDKKRVLMMRNEHFSSQLSVSYANSDPLLILEGDGVYLMDEHDIPYLDTRNNVAHCGHCHPHVVQAVQQQVAKLNTNTRYLHPNITQLAQRLLQKFPPSLTKVFFCNSGSEANDLALRLARTFAGGSCNTIVVEGAYHGHTLAVLEISPYKFEKGTEFALLQLPDSRHRTCGSHIWQVPAPDTFRGPHRNVQTAGEEYARYVEQACDYYQKVKGEKVRAFIMEGGLSIGGVILPPPGYLVRVAKAVRDAGGVYIADEVQTGFGRLGTCFWAWEYNNHDAVPDIVTLGKPFGNGMPLAAVVCSTEVALAFERQGVEYFNTFGGNPVCAAAGLAVLDVIEQEGLQQHALEIGTYMQEQFRAAAATVKYIGDVRGSGLFMGLELVKDNTNGLLEPATAETHVICTVLRQKYHVLTSIDGLADNVLVVKPPMVFDKEHVDQFVHAFTQACLVDLPTYVAKAGGNLLQVARTPT